MEGARTRDERTRLFAHKQRQQCLSFFFLFVITNEGERHERATLHFSFLESIGTDSEHAHKADQTLGVSHFVAGDVVRYNVVVACETLALLPTE